MQRVYKSNVLMVFGKFLAMMYAIATAMLIVLVGLFKLHLFSWDMLPASLIIALVAADITAALCLTFFRFNICIKVNDISVEFYRGKKKYLNFSFSKFAFASFVERNTYNGIHIGTTKYLRVINKASGTFKHYKCYGFKMNSFEELITYVTGMQNKQSIQNHTDTENINAVHKISNTTFSINKELMIENVMIGMRNLALICAAAFSLMGIWFFFYKKADLNFISLLFVIFIAVTCLMFSPYFGFQKKIPERISFNNDYLEVDGKLFYFAQIAQIKITPPTYNNSSIEPKFRKLIIFGEDYKEILYVGTCNDIKDDKPKIFADYQIFFNELKGLCDAHSVKLLMDLA